MVSYSYQETCTPNHRVTDSSHPTQSLWSQAVCANWKTNDHSLLYSLPVYSIWDSQYCHMLLRTVCIYTPWYIPCMCSSLEFHIYSIWLASLDTLTHTIPHHTYPTLNYTVSPHLPLTPPPPHPPSPPPFLPLPLSNHYIGKNVVISLLRSCLYSI